MHLYIFKSVHNNIYAIAFIIYFQTCKISASAEPKENTRIRTLNPEAMQPLLTNDVCVLLYE
jgi:hypothetical protein